MNKIKEKWNTVCLWMQEKWNFVKSFLTLFKRPEMCMAAFALLWGLLWLVIGAVFLSGLGYLIYLAILYLQAKVG